MALFLQLVDEVGHPTAGHEYFLLKLCEAHRSFVIKRFQYAKFAWSQPILADIYLRLRSHRFEGACQDDPQIESW